MEENFLIRRQDIRNVVFDYMSILHKFMGHTYHEYMHGFLIFYTKINFF